MQALSGTRPCRAAQYGPSTTGITHLQLCSQRKLALSSTTKLQHICQEHQRHVAVRTAPEQTQEQQQVSSAPDPRRFVQLDALTTTQEEQEEQLKELTSDLPQREQRLEWLAFWVAAAVAFGAGIW